MKTTGLYPKVHVDTAPVAATGLAGGVLLTETARITGLDTLLSKALAPWRKPSAVLDPGKIVLDLAITLAAGGDALSDIAVLRAEPELYGRVASDPTVSRLITTLGNDMARAVAAIDTARHAARRRAWGLAGAAAPDAVQTASDPLIIDIDGTLITAHSEKQEAAPTFKKGFGFHPLVAFLDHGPDGTGEPLAVLLRRGNAGSNTVTDHITATTQALRQLPDRSTRPGRKVLIRADGAGGTQAFVAWLTKHRLSYSVGYTLPMDTSEIYTLIPEQAWTPAWDAERQTRDGADVVDATPLLDLSAWPAGMRVIIRRERPHPGAQLRFDDVDGYRLTAFATNTRHGCVAELELRHRRRARCEDRIRNAKTTGLRNLPLHRFGQNQIWCLLVALATELQAWTGMLALTGHEARRWEPKRLRYRLYNIPATIARRARHTILHLSDRSPWAELVQAAIRRLQHLPAPAT